MGQVVLYDHKSESIRINVVAFFENDGSLRIDGCDSGKLVKQMWGDFDYEYIITVKPSDLPGLISALGTTKDGLLETIARAYSGERAFSKFRAFLSERKIPFDFFTWA